MIKVKPTNTNIILMLIAAVAVIVGAPLAFIWGLNTLFPVLAIPYNFESWVAVILVKLAITSNVNVNSKD